MAGLGPATHDFARAPLIKVLDRVVS